MEMIKSIYIFIVSRMYFSGKFFDKKVIFKGRISKKFHQKTLKIIVTVSGKKGL